MKSIRAKKDFALNGIAYEKGFIEPLTLKQIQNFGKEPKENKKEEE